MSECQTVCNTSVAFEGLLYVCRTGLWFAPLMYDYLYRDRGRWSCALAHWNRTAEWIAAEGESAGKESPRIEFSSPRATEESRRVLRTNQM